MFQKFDRFMRKICRQIYSHSICNIPIKIMFIGLAVQVGLYQAKVLCGTGATQCWLQVWAGHLLSSRGGPTKGGGRKMLLFIGVTVLKTCIGLNLGVAHGPPVHQAQAGLAAGATVLHQRIKRVGCVRKTCG